MKTRMNFKDEFYQKLKLLVLPIAIQNFMLALVSATDAIMLGWIDQTSLSAVSLAGEQQVGAKCDRNHFFDRSGILFPPVLRWPGRCSLF